MNALVQWFTAPEWALLVKTLLHSLWQGALLAMVLALALRRLNSPHWRYRTALAALASIPLLALVTWSVLHGFSEPSPSELPATPFATSPANAPQLRAHPDVTAIAVVNRSPARPESNWTAWLALLWLVGAGLMLARGAIKVAGADQLRRNSAPLDHPEINRLLAEARRVMRITRQIRLAATDRLTSPAVVGVMVPTLVLPLSLVTTLTPEQIRFVLLHELAHIRRGDYFANLLQLFVEALLFFNPAVWWLSHQVRREREACCDALAIELSGTPADYARTLLQVAEHAIAPTPVAAAAFGAKEHASLLDRVQRLLVPGYQPKLRLTWRAMLVAFALGGALLTLTAEGTRVAVAQINKSQPQGDTHGVDSDSEKVAPRPVAADQFVFQGQSEPDSRPAEASASRLSPLIESNGITDSAGKLDPAPEFRALPLIGDHFVSNTQTNPPRYLRSFAVAPNTFTNDETQTLRDFFRQAGIDLDPAAGKSIYYKPSKGELLIRATQEELDRIQAILSPAHQSAGGAPASKPSQPIQLSGLNPRSAVSFDLSNGTATATGGGTLRTGDASLQADTIQLDTQTGTLKASGKVQLELPRDTAETARTNSLHGTLLTNLFVRTYRVDPNTFYQGLESVTSHPLDRTNMQESVRAFFTSLGVDLNPPRSVFFNDGAGEIFVRAPKADLDVIESALQVMNATTPQVNIKVRFVELDAKTGDGSLDLLLGNIAPASANSSNALRQLAGSLTEPQYRTVSNAVELSKESPQQFTGILTDPQYRAVLRALEQRKDANVLAMQEVTTLSGRQAQIQTVEMRTVVNGLGLPVQPLPGNPATNSVTNLVYQTQVLPFGPVLDVIPFVAADGATIQMTVIPSVTEFLGYDDPGKIPKVPKTNGKEDATLPLPRIRVRQMSANVHVWDGQTLVLSMANDQLVTKKSNGGFVKENLRAPEVKKKQLLVFVTPTIVDPAGNRVNKEVEAASPVSPPVRR